MVKVTGYTKSGNKQEAKVNLEAAIFGATPSHGLLQLAYQAYLANGRSASPRTLTRGLVSGGGKKPWRQKGTGRARVGSSRVPNWRGGGVTFGPTGLQNHTTNLPVKMKRLAIRHALSAQAKDGRLHIIESFDIKDGKTKEAAALLAKLKLAGKVLLVVDERTSLIHRATDNLAALEVLAAKHLNVFTLLNADQIIITKSALEIIESWLALDTKPITATKPTEAKPKTVKSTELQEKPVKEAKK